VAREIAAEEAARREAEALAQMQAELAGIATESPGDEQEPLGGYGNWACEYAEETGQEGGGCGGGAGSRFITYAAGHGTPAPRPGDPGYRRGNANEGGCSAKSKGKSCGKREHGSVNFGELEEWIGIAQCAYEWGDCPGYGEPG
jgi:hypothetical protein